MTDNIYHYSVRLPEGIDEMVVPCYDGFTIYTDERLTAIGREKAYRHAMGHIKRNDWECTKNIQAIESDAHK